MQGVTKIGYFFLADGDITCHFKKH